MSAQLEAVTRISDWFAGDKSRWTQEAFGRDDNGASVPIDDLHDAICCCLTGACYRMGVSPDVLAAALGFDGKVLAMECWNDEPERVFAEVVERLADARKRLEGAQREVGGG